MAKIDKKDFENSAAEYIKKTPIPYFIAIGIIENDKHGKAAEFHWIMTAEFRWLTEEVPKRKSIVATLLRVLEIEQRNHKKDTGACATRISKDDASEVLAYAYLFLGEMNTNPLFVALREIEELPHNNVAVILIVTDKNYFTGLHTNQIESDSFWREMLAPLASRS